MTAGRDGLRNLRLLIEYDGAAFSGWQFQVGRRTIEGELRRAIRELTGAEPRLHAAGRTDAGAHAEGQVVSFVYPGHLALDRVQAALNARLPPEVVILEVDEVPLGFHARYSARWRRYRYRYLDRSARPALDRGRCWHLRDRLDVEAMDEAARCLVGRHDWTTFCSATEPPGGRVRNMGEARVVREGRFVDLHLCAEGFLRGQVRGIAGALAEVGRRRRPPAWVGEILAARDRRLAPRSAPAAGLTLVAVIYDDHPIGRSGEG